ARNRARRQKETASGLTSEVHDLHMVEDGADADYHQVLAGCEGLARQLGHHVAAGRLDDKVGGSDDSGSVEKRRRRLHAREKSARRLLAAAGYPSDANFQPALIDSTQDGAPDRAAPDN